MATRRIAYKVSTLPATPVANAEYLLQKPNNISDFYVTDAAGNLHTVVSDVRIDARAQLLVNAAISTNNATKIVDTIAQRDALGITTHHMVTVLDASADPSVNSGSALYAYNPATSAYSKLSEFESLDVSVDWNAISGKPTATPAQIDTAATSAHTHTNATVLNSLATNIDGDLTVAGTVVQTNWGSTDW